MTTTNSTPLQQCKLYCRKAVSSAEPISLTQLFAEKKFPSILGGNLTETEANRFSVWACEPVEVFTFNAGGQDPFGGLKQALNKYKLRQDLSDGLPEGIFKCGWIGYFSYELGRYIEKLPGRAVDDLRLPLIQLCFYDRAVCYDRVERTWWLMALQMAVDNQAVSDKLNELAGLLREAENICTVQLDEPDMQNIDIEKFNCNITRQYYLEAIEKTRRYIYDGEVYQINFSQRFECDYTASAVELYHWQNLYNPSPYAAYIGGGGFTIVSASPEMFITIRNGVISTKPIKGTRPRVIDKPNAEQVNRANFTELIQSHKEQAELNMIIDLERNDLTRICDYGTIEVIQPRTIEAYPTVYHAVATVQGRLYSCDSKDFGSMFCDILKAVFPGGSITGAPKIRSMEIIDELEPTQRSVYTGSIGFIGIDGNVCLNIAIRTIIIAHAKAYAQTGGGIVADSDPQAEWDETITKARALLAGIQAVKKKATGQRDKGTKVQRHKISFEV